MFMVLAMCGVWLEDRKRSRDLMLRLNETIIIVGYRNQCSLVWPCIEERG